MSIRPLRLSTLALVLLLALPVALLAAPAQAQDSAPEAPEAFLPYVAAADSQVVIDGAIGPGEYPLSFSDATTGLTFYLEHDRVEMKVGLVSPGTGWVGFGYGPEGAGMEGSNLIIGYVEDTGRAVLVDGFGEGHTFVKDEERNGTSDFGAYAGRESAAGTVIEFSYPLRTADPRDYNLSLNQYAALLVSHNTRTDNLSQPHTARSFAYRLFVSENAIQATAVEFEPPEGALQVGQVTPVRVRVTAGGGDLPSGQVSFYRVTSFGRLYLGSGEVTKGEATFAYRPQVGGEVTLLAQLEATPLYPPSEGQTRVQVAGENASPLKFEANSEIGLAWRNPYVVLILVVVGGVWMVFVSTLRLVLLIRKEGQTGAQAAATPKGGAQR